MSDVSRFEDTRRASENLGVDIRMAAEDNLSHFGHRFPGENYRE